MLSFSIVTVSNSVIVCRLVGKYDARCLFMSRNDRNSTFTANKFRCKIMVRRLNFILRGDTGYEDN